MPDPLARPAAAEYVPYFGRYISRVPEGADVLALLAEQLETTGALLGGLDETAAKARYAPGKWSVQELTGHLADTERIMAYRALCVARGEAAPLPGFDEDAYVAAAAFDARPWAEVLEEWRAVRRATLALFRGLPAAALARIGTANGGPMSPRALAYIIAGHEMHHLAVLRERYGVGAAAGAEVAGA
jgi:hypothetical protein